MKDRKILKAPTGFYYTNGKTYGRQIHLAQGADDKAYYLISDEECAVMFNDDGGMISED